MPLPYTGKHGELNFEEDFIAELQKGGWEKTVLKEYTENQFIENWRNILFDINKKELNGVPLSDNEMDLIMYEVNNKCDTPVKSNIYLTGQTICLKRDIDSKDVEHRGKEVYLEIFDRKAIGGGKTRYQIAEQPIFNTNSQYNDRRGDVMLLINGIPVIHIELKASGVDVSEASNQIIKYAKEGVFKGIFGLIQVFFAMTPEETIYFANAGEYNNFNDTFFFHWADRENKPIAQEIKDKIVPDWHQICIGPSALLSIPEAHQLVAYYTVADKELGVLKVVRSYQYHAIKAVLQRVKKQKWGDHNQLGGYIWCTTGGGKTLTSFKAGQLMIDKGLADKVVFVVDRKELNNQSVSEYNSFSRDGEAVEDTTTSNDLFAKLKSTNFKDALLVTSIQKLSNITKDAENLKKADLDYIRDKRIVFIVDEAHRSQFGTMHQNVKGTFVTSLFIGFTGTPIFSENEKEGSTTEQVFGECLSIYSIASGIRDNNVLGFDPKAIKTYEDSDLRERVALDNAKAKSYKEVLDAKQKGDKHKYEVYQEYYNRDMTTKVCDDGEIVKGIEDLIPASQYDNDKHRRKVVENILKNWVIMSEGAKGTKFHALLATSSIPEACEYYKLFKEITPTDLELKVSALFDPHIDNSGQRALDKQDALIEIVEDYNKMYNKNFDRKTDPNFNMFKKDIISRLSHKGTYKNMSKRKNSEQLDILIVVDQLLTGFDSKFVNTLYLDKVLESDKIIQAISRTNRVYDKDEKPFGVFRFYRKPYTMQKNLKEALRLYCEGDTDSVVVKSLEENIEGINKNYEAISNIFKNSDIKDFVCLPKDEESRQKFRKEFYQMSVGMRAIKLQGFLWDEDVDCDSCSNKDTCDGETCVKKLSFNKDTYHILELRYKDSLTGKNRKPGNEGKVGYDIDTYLSEMSMDKIDATYLETHFKLMTVTISSPDKTEDEKQEAIENFEEFFPQLSEKEQKYARRIIQDIKSRSLKVDDTKTLKIYIQEYIDTDLTKRVEEKAKNLGVDAVKLKEIYMSSDDERSLNEHNRFVDLVQSADKQKASAYFKSKGEKISPFKVVVKINEELKSFILNKEE